MKIFRDDGAGVTYLHRDEGSPVIIVPDHGEIMFRWRPVPPSASSNRPTLSCTAPVKLPFLCPKSSDSSRFSGSAEQLIATKG